jgi:hypothetical protein
MVIDEGNSAGSQKTTFKRVYKVFGEPYNVNWLYIPEPKSSNGFFFILYS